MSRRHRELHRGKWARTRRAVFHRDGYRCCKCGKAGRLECDHVSRDWQGDPYDLGNLQTLCRRCHLTKTAGELRRPRPPGAEAWDSMVREIAAAAGREGGQGKETRHRP